ncbi:AraC family transcriptional regulator ligand-binding domain-containing protein [Marinobacter sp. F4216]|uniref:AraC family transcriptional regulator ligand-binding domain-containing protein n=1 Tax=Marinobacter sp. F4216 TaxID=2874281 RepID=UPI001CC1AA4A|nr:AraC family transcriptional regulator [Marinobacter sp. F4216]MBZ2169443.1 AraC family transcriptional regulator [Marinobacter sp. F4216]
MIASLDGAGIDPHKVGRGVPESHQRETAGPFVQLADFVDYLEDAAQQLKDPALGLRLGLQTPLQGLGPLGFLLLNSPTFSAAFENAQNYLRIHQSQAHISVVKEVDRMRIAYATPTMPTVDRFQDGEYSVGVLVKALKTLFGEAVGTPRIELRRPSPANPGHFTRLTECELAFACPQDALIVDGAIAEAPITGADAELLPVLEAHARHLLTLAPGDDELTQRVRQMIAQALPQGLPRLGEIAGQLAMSERTLQRRLDERQLSFNRLIEDIRQQLARAYVAQSSMQFSEIAFLLGYSELSAFGRAFRRWSGSSPSAFRQQQNV